MVYHSDFFFSLLAIHFFQVQSVNNLVQFIDKLFPFESVFIYRGLITTQTSVFVQLQVFSPSLAIKMPTDSG